MSNLNDTKENIQKVKSIIEKHKDKSDLEKEIEVLTEMPEFYESSPYLVKRLCRGEDMVMLDKMLKSLEKVEKGEATLAGTEAVLGEELAQQYLYPSLKQSENKK